MYPCPGNCVAIGHAVLYYDQAPRAITAGMKCRYCSIKVASSIKLLVKTQKEKGGGGMLSATRV